MQYMLLPVQGAIFCSLVCGIPLMARKGEGLRRPLVLKSNPKDGKDVALTAKLVERITDRQMTIVFFKRGMLDYHLRHKTQ